MKVLVLNKKSFAITILVFVLAVALITTGISFLPQAVETMSGNRLLPIYNVDKTEKVASLTFDAAWGNEDTQTLINTLNKYHIHATFFVVGQWVDKYPESVKALSDAGNDVMNHSDTHPHMTKISRDEMVKQVNTCDEKIEKITGKKPTLFRPPYGDYNNNVIEAISSTKHYAIQWNVDSLDWKGISASQIEQRVMSKVKPGSIILFHNAAKHTPEALPSIIENLQKQGYKLVTVSQLIYKENYTIDTAGMQHSAASSSVPASSDRSSQNSSSIASSSAASISSGSSSRMKG